MNEALLMSLGLSQNQSKAYRALILRKSLRPTTLSKLIGESRTNCYAILERLVEIGLATKVDENKKFTFYPASPAALKTLLNKQLVETEQKLAELDRKMPELMSAYRSGGDLPKVKAYRGKHELEKMYQKQMEEPGRELYFVRSKADVPYFGLEKMEEIRYLAPRHKKRRYGVTPIAFYTPADPKKDAKAGSLRRAWLSGEEYIAPVEWAVSGNTVQAICMDGEGTGVSITHPEIAESFRQIMQLLFKYIRIHPDQDKLRSQAKYGQIK